MMVNSFRTRAAISAAGAAVVAALSVVAAPTTHAQNGWGGIATNTTGRWAIWFDKPTENDARVFGKYSGCGSGEGCFVRLTFPDCAALAYNGTTFTTGQGSTQTEAENAATGPSGSRIVASGCNGAGSAAANGQA
jgi:hypothetical protein